MSAASLRMRRAARRRAAFLAEAGSLLAQTVDQASTLLALTKLALPLCAWCIVDILEEGGGIHRLGIYHPDPEKQKLAVALEASWRPEPDDAFGAPAMLRDARTIAITENIEVTLAASAHSVDNLHILRQLGIGSLLTVPLIARQRLLGQSPSSAANAPLRIVRPTSRSPKAWRLEARLPSTMRKCTTWRWCCNEAPRQQTKQRLHSSAR